jgi:type IV pilus assembly protein PilE
MGRNTGPGTGRAARGFTLGELMITVAIVAILSAIAYPSYVRYGVRANRSAAESFMLEVSSRQERYLVDARQYAPDLATLGIAVPPTVSPNYNLSIINVTTAPPGYTVQAAPVGAQLSNDVDCGTLSISGSGAKGASGAGGVVTCWNR